LKSVENTVWRLKTRKAQIINFSGGKSGNMRGSPNIPNLRTFCEFLSCLDAATGKLVWRKDPFPKIVPQFFTAMSPIIIDGMVIAHLGGKGNGAVISYDLTTGNQKWQWAGEGPEYASPALLTVEGTKQIVTLAEKSVVGIAVADGKLLWQLPIRSPKEGLQRRYTDHRRANCNLYRGRSRHQGCEHRKAGGRICRQRDLEQLGDRTPVQHADTEGWLAIRPFQPWKSLLR
jgi:hypothetical protein